MGIAAGELLLPTLYVAGPALHDGSVKSGDAAAALIEQQKEAGFDLIKSHSISDPEIYDVVQTTSARLKLAVSGHVTDQIGIMRALEAHQQIEHLDGFLRALTPEDAGVAPFGQFPPPDLLDQLDFDQLDGLAAQFKQARVWNTPTLNLFDVVADKTTSTEEMAARPEMRFLPPSVVAAWSKQRNQMPFGSFPDAFAPRFAEVRGQMVRALKKAGAPLLAGSDSPQFFQLSGFALHAELAALDRAGLTPWEVLETATANPARYFTSLPAFGSAHGYAADFGTIEKSQRADLVLLRADPTESMANSRTIEGVMLRGRHFDRQQLDELLDQVEKSARP